MDIRVGDVIKMKKKHPCGSFEWEVLRIGADFRSRVTIVIKAHSAHIYLNLRKKSRFHLIFT